MQHNSNYQTMLDDQSIQVFGVIEKMKGLYGRCSISHLMRHCKITFQAASNYLAYYDLHTQDEQEIFNIVNHEKRGNGRF